MNIKEQIKQLRKEIQESKHLDESSFVTKYEKIKKLLELADKLDELKLKIINQINNQ